MNVGIFTDVYTPSINGVTTSIELTRAELLRRGHTVVVFAPFYPNLPLEEGVVRLPAIQQLSPKTFPIGLPVVGHLGTVRDLKLDIIHTHNPFFVGQFGKRVAKNLGLPHIHTYHTYYEEYAHYFPLPPAEPLVKHYLKRLSRTFCNSTALTIAPSTAIRDLLRGYGVTVPIEINPTGIDLAGYHRLSFKERAKLFAEYHIPNHELTLLFGGRLAKEKNLSFLLDAFQSIAKKYPASHLILAGGGPEEDQLHSLINKLNLTKRVTITGFLAHSEIQRFFGAADIFTFTSTTETQGIVIAEAMAGGTPVVAINAMGPADTIIDGINGFLTEDSQAAFITALEKLLNDKVLRIKFSQAAVRCAQNFSIQTTTDRLLTIYETAVDQVTDLTISGKIQTI